MNSSFKPVNKKKIASTESGYTYKKEDEDEDELFPSETRKKKRFG